MLRIRNYNYNSTHLSRIGQQWMVNRINFFKKSQFSRRIYVLYKNIYLKSESRCPIFGFMLFFRRSYRDRVLGAVKDPIGLRDRAERQDRSFRVAHMVRFGRATPSSRHAATDTSHPQTRTRGRHSAEGTDCLPVGLEVRKAISWHVTRRPRHSTNIYADSLWRKRIFGCNIIHEPHVRCIISDTDTLTTDICICAAQSIRSTCNENVCVIVASALAINSYYDIETLLRIAQTRVTYKESLPACTCIFKDDRSRKHRERDYY